MKKPHIVLISMLVWLSVLVSFLILAPKNAQGNLPGKLEYPAPMSTYIIEKKFFNISFVDSLEINIPFTVPKGALAGYNSSALFTWFATMQSDDLQRIVILNYTFSSNKQYFDHWEEHFVGLNGTRMGGHYSPFRIKPDTLRTGDNELAMNVSFITHAEKPAYCYFFLNISNARVDVEPLDLDGDAILDPVDPLPGFNNYISLPILAAVGFPAIMIVTRLLPRKH